MPIAFSLVPGSPSPTPVVRSSSLGGLKLRFPRITTDNAYATGGYPITPANFLLDTRIVKVTTSLGASGFAPVWDPVAQKLKFFKVGAAGPAVECAANEATLNNAVFDLEVWGY